MTWWSKPQQDMELQYFITIDGINMNKSNGGLTWANVKSIELQGKLSFAGMDDSIYSLVNAIKFVG